MEHKETKSWKYKIPENCLALAPSKTNDEIQPCLPEAATKHERCIVALQSQLGHRLSVIATVTDQILPVPEHANKVKTLGEACQTIANVHNALSIHRKYKIISHLHPDCAKVVKAVKMDECLFSRLP